MTGQAVEAAPETKGAAWLLGRLDDLLEAQSAQRSTACPRPTCCASLARLSGRDEGQVQPVEVALGMREDPVVPGVGASADWSGGCDALADEVEIPWWGAVPGVLRPLLRLRDAVGRCSAMAEQRWTMTSPLSRSTTSACPQHDPPPIQESLTWPKFCSTTTSRA
ncbi:hypothetical protein [Janibacter alittae]|uniref:Uncharacterized protein n=1 Tax=Janibacter alittae TaxID=3115209 RepID=A0ABZ2ME73_9MICO